VNHAENLLNSSNETTIDGGSHQSWVK